MKVVVQKRKDGAMALSGLPIQTTYLDSDPDSDIGECCKVQFVEFDDLEHFLDTLKRLGRYVRVDKCCPAGHTLYRLTIR